MLRLVGQMRGLVRRKKGFEWKGKIAGMNMGECNSDKSMV